MSIETNYGTFESYTELIAGQDQRISSLTAEVEQLRAKLVAQGWQRLTAASKRTESVMYGKWAGKYWIMSKPENSDDVDVWLKRGYTHFRSINPPTKESVL